MQCPKNHEMRDLGMWPVSGDFKEPSALQIRHHCPECNGWYHEPVLNKRLVPVAYKVGSFDVVDA